MLEGRILRSVSTLAGGTAGAQVITLLLLPVLTRIFTPEDFSVLAAYMAIFSLFSVVACLRLEIAIPLPADEDEAVNLLAASIAMAMLTALMLATILSVAKTAGWHFGNSSSRIEQFYWIVPVSVGVGATYSALLFWATRKKRFRSIATTRLVQTSGGGLSQIMLGWIGIAPLGLLLGHLIMNVLGVLKLGIEALKLDLKALKRASVPGVREAVSSYRRLPQYSTVESFANSGSVQIPVLIVATLAIGPEAGFILLASRAVGTPVTLIGKAVSQVYLSEAPSAHRSGELTQLSYKLVMFLSILGVAPLVLLGIIAPFLFSFFFGDQWARAGELVLWMTPWFVFKLLSSPIANVMHVRMLQSQLMILMLYGLVLRTLITLGAFYVDVSLIAEGYAISGALFYATASLVYGRAAGFSRILMFRILGITLTGVLVGYVISLFFLSLLG